MKLVLPAVAACLFAGALALSACTESTTSSSVSGGLGPGAGTGGGGGVAPPPPGQPAAGSIQFVSATPNAVGIAGSGQPTTSTIVFLVSDAGGVALPGAAVNFTMIGPGGGTYIGPPDATPTTATGTTDSAGNVSVILNAGAVPGPATIIATVTSSAGTFSTSSSVISIGGAVPSGSHFSFVAVRHNLPGLVKVGFTTNVSAFIGDRFSNYNLLAGTQVSFFTEAGAVDTSSPMDATGVATAVFRTQAPDPSPGGLPGIVTVIAVVRGEEGFTDSNANGVFDAGEPFSDAGEPFIDANENGVYDAGEFFVDTNSNGVYDGPNGVWDGPGCAQAGCNPSPLIWQAQRMVFTGNITSCTFFPAAINVPNGGSQTFTAFVADSNGNAPGPGTSVSFSATGGTLQGATSVTVPDIVGGPFAASITLLDAAPAGSPTPGAITMTVISTEVVACPPVTINGTVN
jgi:hypothetical protein